MSETKSCYCRAAVELQSSQLSTAEARRLSCYSDPYIQRCRRICVVYAVVAYKHVTKKLKKPI